MADASEIIAGPARDWLAAKRRELNGRFRLAQRRFPRLGPEAVLPLCRELLPALAGAGEPGSAELLASVYELILLHAGRGTLAPLPAGDEKGGGSSPAIGELLRVTFPRMRRLLLARPTDLPAALSNAVENLGVRGLEMARGLAELADHVTDADELLNAGAVLAWRLGEARLRTTALATARRLAPSSAKRALGIAAWPDRAVELVITGLEADGWRRPEEMRTTVAPLAEPPTDANSAWWQAGLLGNFRGFDGHFDRPPLLLDAGAQGSRHRFWVRCGTALHRLDGDVFGWVCRPDASADFPIGTDKITRKRHLALLAKATSWIECENLIAFTLADSFRVRLFAPERRPA